MSSCVTMRPTMLYDAEDKPLRAGDAPRRAATQDRKMRRTAQQIVKPSLQPLSSSSRHWPLSLKLVRHCTRGYCFASTRLHKRVVLDLPTGGFGRRGCVVSGGGGGGGGGA